MDDSPDRIGCQSAGQQGAPRKFAQSQPGQRDDKQRGGEQGGRVGAVGRVRHRGGVEGRDDQAGDDGHWHEHSADGREESQRLAREREGRGQQDQRQNQHGARKAGDGFDQ